MKNRRDEMRNIWCNDVGKPFDKNADAYTNIPYSTSFDSTMLSPNQFQHSPFSLAPLNIVDRREDDDIATSRDSESPISDVDLS